MTGAKQKLSPEGMSPAQEKLAGMFFDRKTVAPVNRRRTLPNGGFEFYKVDREMSIIDFPVTDEEFAIKKHDTDPGAPLSPIYINIRNLPSDVLEQYGIVTSEIMTTARPDYCAGIPKAGLPLARAYSVHAGIPAVDIFQKEEANDGSGQRKIVASEQNFAGKKLRIIDDLATGGDTKLEAAKAAEAMGFEITDIVVLVDRLQGAKEQLAEAGYTLRAAFTIKQLMDYGLRTGRLTKEKYEQIVEYLGIPA